MQPLSTISMKSLRDHAAELVYYTDIISCNFFPYHQEYVSKTGYKATRVAMYLGHQCFVQSFQLKQDTRNKSIEFFENWNK